MIDRELANRVVEFMNGVLEIDPEAISSLCNFRTPCNEGLEEHPTVQVGKFQSSETTVGLLGLLNGLCGTAEDGYGAIAAMTDLDTGEVTSFEVIR